MVEKKKKKDMIPISVERKTAEALEKLGHMHDTYDSVIRRLIDGNGKPHEKEGREEDEDASRGIPHKEH